MYTDAVYKKDEIEQYKEIIASNGPLLDDDSKSLAEQEQIADTIISAGRDLQTIIELWQTTSEEFNRFADELTEMKSKYESWVIKEQKLDEFRSYLNVRELSPLYDVPAYAGPWATVENI